MDISHDGRPRHRQIARTLGLAAISAALAGGGVAVAAGGGGTPATTKDGSSGTACAKPDEPRTERGPLAADDPIVADARAALQRLVADGTIEPSEADAVLDQVIAGSVELDDLVRDGKVAEGHTAAIRDAITKVKLDHRPAGGEQPGEAAVKRAKEAAARRAGTT